MKSNNPPMVRGRLILCMLLGAAALALASLPVQAQSRKDTPLLKSPCASVNHAPCRTAHAADTPGDYGGTGQTDYPVWRPSTGTWYVLSSFNTALFFYQQWGLSGDIPVPGDYDGNGVTDLAVWRPSIGTWLVISSASQNQYYVQQWGLPGDVPVPGDYDGDGITDFAVWRPSNGTWYIIPSSNPTQYIVQQWGLPGDIPMPGDYTGEGQTDFVVWRPSNGTWYVLSSATPGEYIVQQWGLPGDTPVTGDYDGDGIIDMAVWRPSNGTWYVIPSSAPTQYIVQQWGVPDDIPMPGDYDADGLTDFAVWRPSNAVWYVIPSSAPTNYLATQWGVSTDLPVVNTAPSLQMFESTPFGARSTSSGTPEVAGNPPVALSAARCPAAEEAQCATPPVAQTRSVGEAEAVIGPQRDRAVEQAVKRFAYWMPPDLQRHSGNVAPDTLTRLLSDAPQFVGAPPNMRPEEVGKKSILPLPPSDQKRP